MPSEAKFILIPLIAVLTLLLLSSCYPAKNQLNWLEGCWETETGQTRETWTFDPQTRSLIGIGQTFSKPVKGEKPQVRFTETLTIRPDGNIFLYIAKPGNAAPTEFRETERGAQTVTFENADHDYPQRIKYQQAGSPEAPTLTATISRIDGSKQNSWQFSKGCAESTD